MTCSATSTTKPSRASKRGITSARTFCAPATATKTTYASVNISGSTCGSSSPTTTSGGTITAVSRTSASKTCPATTTLQQANIN